MLAGWRERNCLARDVRKVRESAARVSPAPEGWMGQQPGLRVERRPMSYGV